jgi:UDP-N-acetylglucosamine 2-epimerase (non-hydrolysing)
MYIIFTIKRSYNQKLKKLNAALVLGTRPQIIKSAPFIYLANIDTQMRLDVIHTGQHYDYEMTKIFFEELDLLDPVTNLNVGSGTHAQQTAKILIHLENILQKHKPDLVIVPGDTNSTLAGALTAAKLHLPIAHIEAGARSYDMKMPEEINRRLTDHCSTLLFTPTENCTKNLLNEGINKKNIYQTGDTMYDVLLQQLPKAEKTTILNKLHLKQKSYVLLTTHRPENVDNPTNLKNICEAIMNLTPLTTIFPAHPRTRKQLQTLQLFNKIKEQKHVRLIDPIGYHEILKLIKNAKFILTDSGGMQKEAFWLKTPCITLRNNTEWTETIHLEANSLTGSDPQKIGKEVHRILTDEQIQKKLQRLPNPFGDGNASQKIINSIKHFFEDTILPN